MNVLIMSVTAGFGHISTAQAVQDALVLRGIKSEIIDTLKYVSPVLERTVADGYEFSTKRIPSLYRSVYNALDRQQIKSTNSTEIFQNLHIPSKFVALINDYNPDVILCTHIFSAQIMDALKRKGKISAKLIGIVTDYTIHPMWENIGNMDYIITASELLSLQARRKGVDMQKILPLGIPCNPKFLKSIPKSEARAALGLNPDRPTILLMSGGTGYNKLASSISAIDALELNIQILAVCGSNTRMYNSLIKKNYPSHIKVYAFVNNVDVMMDAADCIVTKPGGLTTTEALIKGLPMIMQSPIPGQEERNLEFLLNNGLALFVTKFAPLEEAVYYLFTSPERVESLRASIRRLAKPNAVEDIANLIESMGMQA